MSYGAAIGASVATRDLRRDFYESSTGSRYWALALSFERSLKTGEPWRLPMSWS